MFRGLFFALMCFVMATACTPEARLKRALTNPSGTIDLPSGDIDLHEPIVLDGAKNVTLRGPDTKLRMRFEGEAAIILRKVQNVQLEEFAIEGNRETANGRVELPPSDQPMARWNKNNGILIEDSGGVTVRKLTIRMVPGYAVLVNHSRDVNVSGTLVSDSGSLDAKGKN